METHYKIIGGDGCEYGPVNLDELKNWIRDGRVGPQTKVLRSDLRDWLSVARFQELQTALGISTQPPVVVKFETVGFWPRVGAYLIDQVVLGVIALIILGPDRSHASLWEMMQNGGPRLLPNFLISLAYYVILNGHFGATVGKMVIGARIVSMDGIRIGYGKAFLRFFAWILSAIILGIGYLMVAFRADKRGLHDLLVETRVIYKR
ncbi:MAG: RDD family protein [Verrucomicrobiota bacterium]